MSAEKIKQLREMSGAGMLDCKKALDHSNGDLDGAVEWLRKQGITKAAKKAGNIAAEGVTITLVNGASKNGVIIEINSQTDFVAQNKDFINLSEGIAKAILESNIKNTEDVEKVKSDLSYGGKTILEHEIELTAKIGEKISFRRFSKIEDDVVVGYTHTNKRVAVLLGGKGISNEVLRDIALHAAAMNPKYISREDVGEDFVAKETEILKEQYSKSMADKPPHILENIIKGAVNKQIAEIILLEQPFVKDASKKIKDVVGSGKINFYTRYEVGEGIEKAENNFAEEVKKAAQS